MSDLIDRQKAIDALDCINGVEEVLRSLPPAQPHTYRGVTLNDVMMYFDSLEGNEDAWTEFCSCFECRGWGLYHIRSATDKNVGTNDTISRQAAIEALKNDMASLDHIIKGMSANDVRLDAYVSQRNQVDYDIDTISNLPPAQPKELDTLIKALEAEHKKLREMQKAQSVPHWIPVTVINQNYIPELKDFPYGGVLFTYRTPKGKLLVREAWVERGRIIGKKMNGTPIAYQQKPEPWEGDAE